MTTQIASSNIQSSTLATFGKILQVYQAVKTDTFVSASTSWADITGLSITLTPQSSGSRFLLISDLALGPAAGPSSYGSYAQRFTKNGSVITGYIGDAAGTRPRAMAVAYPGDGGGAGANFGITKLYVDSPATTSSITYAIQVAGSTTSPGYVNRSFSDRDAGTYDARLASSFTVLEIGA